MDAKESGELKDGQTVVELTSGNTRTGLAIVCGVLGHPFVAVMSAGNSVERARMMRALGARVEIVPQTSDKPGKVSGKDIEAMEQRTQELVKELSALRGHQFGRMSNPKSHFDGTATEIWEASNGTVTAFCDFVGTVGTFGGCASLFKPRGVKCYVVVEPVGAAVLAGEAVTNPDHRIQGGGYFMDKLPALNPDDTFAGVSSRLEDADGFIQVSDNVAIQTARDLARLEGIYAGFSAGANVYAALDILRREDQIGCTVAALICDSGLKYLSTDLWE